ncbi:MAG: hypothetical protein ACRBFS_08150 [Aureispira sp.]
MIKFYLDWNIFSYLKEPKHKAIRDKIQKLKSQLLFPYSHSHFIDLSKSYSTTNKYFDEDLATLEEYTRNFKIGQNKEKITFEEYSPTSYFYDNKEELLKPIFINFKDNFKVLDELKIGDTKVKIGSIFQSLLDAIPLHTYFNDENLTSLNSLLTTIDSSSSLWDLVNSIASASEEMLQDKSKYIEIRKQLGYSGLKLPSHSGGWEIKNVINNVNSFLKNQGHKIDFAEYSNLIFKHRKEKPNDYESFSTLYIHLDLIGFKSDKLSKKSNNFLNITTDAAHAYLASYCDYFIVNDKNLITKSKVLYSELQFETEVLNLQEFEKLLDNLLLYAPRNISAFLQQAKSTINEENLIESHLSTTDDEVDILGYKIQPLLLNYFNAVTHEIHNCTTLLTFKRVYRSKGFSYTQEIEALLDNLIEVLGFPSNYLNFKQKKQVFLENKEQVEMLWELYPTTIILKKHDDLCRALLIVINI